jgi:hypothetical protein
MRLIGFLLFVLGLVLMLAPERLTQMLVDREIARATVFENGEFRPFEIALGPSQAPLALVIRAEEGGVYNAGTGMAALTLVASHSLGSAFASGVSFDASDRSATPDNHASGGAVTYEKRVGRIAELASGPYRFVAAEGDADVIDLRRVELVLLANAFALPDFSNFAIGMVWAGAIIWFIGQRRRSRKLAANPPAASSNKWGRGQSG